MAVEPPFFFCCCSIALAWAWVSRPAFTWACSWSTLAPFRASVSCWGVTCRRLATSFRNAWRVGGAELWVAA